MTSTPCHHRRYLATSRQDELQKTANTKDIQQRSRMIQKKISSYIPPTPLIKSHYLSQKHSVPIYLKLENLNISGSFKVRGAAAALLSWNQDQLKKLGVVVASAGNHGQGVAYISRTLGIKATVFMPENTPLIKVEATRRLGAEVILAGKTFHRSQEAMHRWQKQHHSLILPPFEHSDVIAGQSTVALEILDQLGDLAVAIMPVGGGGLIGGVASVLKSHDPQIQVIGVQSEMCCPVTRELAQTGRALCPNLQLASSQSDHKSRPGVLSNHDKETHHHHLECQRNDEDRGVDTLLADGIAVKRPGDTNLQMIHKYVDLMCCVDEEAVAGSIMELLERDHLAVEGAGAVSVAALDRLLARHLGLTQGPVVCVLSGGNIDASVLSRITRKGLAYSGRMMRLTLNLKDSPGVLAALLGDLGKLGANLYHIDHNRIFSDHSVKEARVTVDLEITDRDHGDLVRRQLVESGYDLRSDSCEIKGA